MSLQWTGSWSRVAMLANAATDSVWQPPPQQLRSFPFDCWQRVFCQIGNSVGTIQRMTNTIVGRFDESQIVSVTKKSVQKPRETIYWPTPRFAVRVPTKQSFRSSCFTFCQPRSCRDILASSSEKKKESLPKKVAILQVSLARIEFR